MAGEFDIVTLMVFLFSKIRHDSQASNLQRCLVAMAITPRFPKLVLACPPGSTRISFQKHNR